MADDRARTFLTNNLSARRITYLPPNGQVVGTGATVTLPGIIETMLFLANPKGLEIFLAELAAGDISVRYDFAQDTDVGAGGPGGDVNAGLSPDDQNIASLATAGDGSPTGVNISNTPSSDGLVAVFINGNLVAVGDGVKTETTYFSPDGGTTARLVGDIILGDELIWNGVVATYDLDTSDIISLVYVISVAVSSSSSP